MPSRTAAVSRRTQETDIELKLDIDGRGQADVSTGIGFFDHMLDLFSRHSLVDLSVQAKGDLQTDAHHTVEDVGICIGRALHEALGDKSGIRRYGQRVLPMDEALVTAAVDLSGRAYFSWNVDVPIETLGQFNSQLGEEFWRAVATEGRFNLHIIGHAGRNTHHILEAVFKAVARSLREAMELDPRQVGVPSTKGVLSELS